MNKNYTLAIGVIVSLAAISFLLIDNDIDVNSIESKEIQSQSTAQKIKNSVSIDYKNTDKSTIDSEASKQLNTQVPEREKFLEANTYDKTKKFEIALINPYQDLSKPNIGHTTLQGEIDGLPFFLHVPKQLIAEGSGATELRIKNLETGDITSVSAAFIDDMRNPKMKQKISIDSKDVENYRQEELEQIVPLRPGELRE